MLVIPSGLYRCGGGRRKDKLSEFGARDEYSGQWSAGLVREHGPRLATNGVFVITTRVRRCFRLAVPVKSARFVYSLGNMESMIGFPMWTVVLRLGGITVARNGNNSNIDRKRRHDLYCTTRINNRIDREHNFIVILRRTNSDRNRLRLLRENRWLYAAGRGTLVTYHRTVFL